jgi:hypothetical protein
MGVTGMADLAVFNGFVALRAPGYPILFSKSDSQSASRHCEEAGVALRSCASADEATQAA